MKRIHEDKRYNKQSLNALKVAEVVKLKLARGEKINKREIAVSNGYSINSAKSNKPYDTKTFKRAMSDTVTFMNEIKAKALVSIHKKDLDKERLDSLVNLSKQMIHDTQLLSGKSTENVSNNVVVYGTDDFLALNVEPK